MQYDRRAVFRILYNKMQWRYHFNYCNEYVLRERLLK